MNTTAEDYIRQVVDCVPDGTPLRAQIAMELNAHIAERMANGHSLSEVLKLLGEPRTLAESYLAAVPLVAAPFMTRAAAKILDLLTVLIVVGAMVWITALLFFPSVSDVWALIMIGVMFAVIGSSFVFAIYTVIAETLHGRTLGKRWLGLRVVTETGTRISLGQAIVRQVPMFLQFYYIDVLFALFTERKQRAFEMLSKTRVVAEPGNAPAA